MIDSGSPLQPTSRDAVNVGPRQVTVRDLGQSFAHINPAHPPQHRIEQECSDQLGELRGLKDPDSCFPDGMSRAAQSRKLLLPTLSYR